MKGVIGSAVPLRSLVPIVEFQELAGLHVARVDSARQVRDSGDLVAKADRLQGFGGLRAYIDRGADLAQAGAASKTSAFVPKVVSAFAAARPASPPPTIAILQLGDIRPLQARAETNPRHDGPSIAGPARVGIGGLSPGAGKRAIPQASPTSPPRGF